MKFGWNRIEVFEIESGGDNRVAKILLIFFFFFSVSLRGYKTQATGASFL